MSNRNFTYRFDVVMTLLSSDKKITVQQCYICGLKSDFEKLRFNDGLVWTVGQTVEIKLRFQISLVWTLLEMLYGKRCQFCYPGSSKE